MKHWRRTSSSGATPAAPPAPVTVTAVVLDPFDDTHCTWFFSSAIAVNSDASGLTVNGDAPVVDLGHAGNTWSLFYPNPVSVGDLWNCDAATTIVTFTSGGSLIDGSGAVA